MAARLGHLNGLVGMNPARGREDHDVRVGPGQQGIQRLVPLGAGPLDELVRLLRELNPQQGAAVLLTSILDYSAQEAGRMLGIGPSSVRSLTTRARARMKDKVVDPA